MGSQTFLSIMCRSSYAILNFSLMAVTEKMRHDIGLVKVWSVTLEIPNASTNTSSRERARTLLTVLQQFIYKSRTLIFDVHAQHVNVKSLQNYCFSINKYRIEYYNQLIAYTRSSTKGCDTRADNVGSRRLVSARVGRRHLLLCSGLKTARYSGRSYNSTS